MEMDWKHDLLWKKSVIYAYTAHKQDKEKHFFPLWCAASLELLSRACLAFVHPALLADPSEGSNILYVFGYHTEQRPAKSIPIKTVFERLTKIVDPFTKKEYEVCMNFMERRNRELHSGGAAFEDYPTKIWLAEFYRICNILIKFQRKKIKDWLPENDAKIALGMIKKDYVKIKSKVTKLIKKHKDNFYRKTAIEQRELWKESEEKIDSPYKFGIFLQTDNSSKIICPACKAKALISGQISSSNEPYIDGDQIVNQISILPTSFNCYACELKLSGYNQLQAADLGGYINKEQRFDAKEYYDFHPSDFFESDYGND